MYRRENLDYLSLRINHAAFFLAEILQSRSYELKDRNDVIQPKSDYSSN